MISLLPTVVRRFFLPHLVALLGATTLAACSADETPIPPDTSSTAAHKSARTHIDNALAGWIATGVDLTPGQSAVLVAEGSWEIQGLVLEPKHVLWYRVGDDGEARNFEGNTAVFTASAAGELYLTLRPVGLYWDDARGTYPEGFTEQPALPVDMHVNILTFDDAPEQGLARLAAAADNDDDENRINAMAASALEAIRSRPSLPAGFSDLNYLGRSTIWADRTADGGPGIHVDSDDDVHIVKMPLDIPLTPETTIGFDWRYDALPAQGPEDQVQFHDYVSIALEFDNGQDLTWFWSRELAPGTHFGCPLDWWDERETHYVLQSGDEGLGRWHSHQRPVLADYEASISVPGASRIVGVWFISNSLFGRQRAAASFRNVIIANGDERVTVFEP